MKIVLILLNLISSVAFADHTCPLGPIRIGVIDTGFGYEGKGLIAPLCKYGHKDFGQDQFYSHTLGTKDPIPTDVHAHGTNIVGLIDQYASKGKSAYCFVIIKIYSQKATNRQNAEASTKALQYVNNLNIEIVNYSGGGPGFVQEEKDAVQKYLGSGGRIIAAAGNNGINLTGEEEHAFYPAMYDSRITVVGNVDKLGNRVKSSNYGKLVTVWENGVDQIGYGIKLTGTSQATAIHTGKVVSAIKSCDRRK